MKLFLKSVMILASVVLLATLVLADPPYNTGGRWENGAGVNQIIVDVSLATVVNGNVDVKMGDEKITLQGGWDTDSSTGSFGDGTRVRVRCNNSPPWNCWVEVMRIGSNHFVRMRWIGPTPVPPAPGPSPAPVDGTTPPAKVDMPRLKYPIVP